MRMKRTWFLSLALAALFGLHAHAWAHAGHASDEISGSDNSHCVVCQLSQDNAGSSASPTIVGPIAADPQADLAVAAGQPRHAARRSHAIRAPPLIHSC